MLKAKILVSGASGTNGQALLNKLTEANIQVRAMVRKKRYANHILHENVEIVEADLSDTKHLQAAFEGIDQAYIATAINQNSVCLFDNFFNAAKQADVRHIVKLSGYGAAADSRSAILQQHYESDEILINSGLNYTIIQPNSFFQNILLQARSIRTRNRFRLPLGSVKQSFIDVSDIAEATLNILTDKQHLNKVYQLTGAEALSCYDIAEQLSTVLDRNINYQPILPERAEQEMIAAGMPEWNARALAEIQQDFADGGYDEITDDIKSILARDPRKFIEFIQDHINEFLNP
jgi:uncharacterized protein YbjT (DUF2867 family)